MSELKTDSYDSSRLMPSSKNVGGDQNVNCFMLVCLLFSESHGSVYLQTSLVTDVFKPSSNLLFFQMSSQSVYTHRCISVLGLQAIRPSLNNSFSASQAYVHDNLTPASAFITLRNIACLLHMTQNQFSCSDDRLRNSKKSPKTPHYEYFNSLAITLLSVIS